MRKKSIAAAILAALVIVLTFTSCSVNQKGAQYKEIDGGWMLYRYSSSSTETEFTVPDTYEGKPVLEISDFGLANAEYLTKITIGKNVQKINDWSLTNCPKLKEFVVDAENTAFTTVDGVLYTKDLTELVSYPNGKTELVKDGNDNVIGGGTLILPDTCKRIRPNAAYLCGNLYTVQLNEGLEAIGDKAFLKCWHYSELKIPSTVTAIGADAFSYTDSLKNLEIPSNVQSIGDYAFYSTGSSIEKVIVHNTEENLELGKDWSPHKKNSVREKVPVEFTGAYA